MLEVIFLTITIKELLSLNNPNIIDIRSVENYNNNHIPGAKNILYQELLINPIKYLNKNNVYYIYCRKGFTSLKLCEILRKQGYYVFSVVGGYEAWILHK